MCSRPDEIEIVIILGTIMRSEPCRLRENRLNGECGSQAAVQFMAEVQRVDTVLSDDIFLQIREIVVFQELHDDIAIRFGSLRPIDAGTRSEEHTSELQSPCNLVC